MERFDHFDLSLDTVQAPEPEDLASAQLHLCMVDFVQPLSILGDLLFGGAMPSLLQELQGLGRYRGNDLAPQQLSNTNEEAPEPLGQGELRATEGFAPNSTMMIWLMNVPNTTEQKMRLRKMPEKTFLSPWILRELISLKSCMSTKVLKIMV